MNIVVLKDGESAEEVVALIMERQRRERREQYRRIQDDAAKEMRLSRKVALYFLAAFVVGCGIVWLSSFLSFISGMPVLILVFVLILGGGVGALYASLHAAVMWCRKQYFRECAAAIAA
jgi:F0F1-type ATP synthase assembly protein I